MKILYVGDNVQDAERVRQQLAQNVPPMQTEVVTGEKLPDLPASAWACDVVVLDGLDTAAGLPPLVQTLRQQGRLSQPLLLVVGQEGREAAVKALRPGMDACLVRDDAFLCKLPLVIENLHQRSELLRERAAMEEKERHIRLLLESTAEAIYGVDLEGRCTFVNPACLRLLGYDRAEELVGRPIHELIHHSHPDGRSYPREECLVHRAFQRDEAIHRDDEVFWRKDGVAIPVEYWSHPIRRDGRVVGAVTTFFDIGARQAAEERLRHSEAQLDHLAHYDPLTDLPNRSLLQIHLAHALERTRRHDGRLAVLHIDLDRFKLVNDSLGHTQGDELLKAVAQRLKARSRREDTLGRLGGDKFMLILESLSDIQDAANVARDLLATLASPFRCPQGQEVFLSASIGISVHPEDGDTAEALMHAAEVAMDRSKERGRGSFRFYVAAMNADTLGMLTLEADLRRALERRELVLHYQPKVDLGSGAITGAEALLRWQRNGAPIPPSRFIPLAEKTGLILPIGAWAIDEACRQLAAWRDQGMRDLGVAVNVSASQFRDEHFEATMAAALARHGIAPGRLELELTESMLMEDPAAATQLLHRLKARGVKLSLDDFGTGYSSLSYLGRFPIDTLKIDQSFVGDMVADPLAASIVAAVIGLAQKMGWEVVAEGVETQAQLGRLRRQGCHQMQGFLFSPPLPAHDFAALLQAGKSLPVAQETPERQRTLLLVDDDAHILSSLQRLLRHEGYRILTAHDAQEGLELLALHEVQVILSDQRMPGMNGTDFLSRVKSLYPDTVRIVLSGFAELDTIIQAVNQGAIYKFLIKPWEDDLLRAHLRDAFRYFEAVLRPREQVAEDSATTP